MLTSGANLYDFNNRSYDVYVGYYRHLAGQLAKTGGKQGFQRVGEAGRQYTVSRWEGRKRLY